MGIRVDEETFRRQVAITGDEDRWRRTKNARKRFTINAKKRRTQ